MAGGLRDCSINVVKTKALISFAVTVKLICVFVFAYAKSRFSHDVAHYFNKAADKLWLQTVVTNVTNYLQSAVTNCLN